MAADKYRCRECLKNITASGQNPSPLRYRKHDKGKGAECPNSRTIIPAWLVKRGPESDDSDVPAVGRDYAPCPECGRSPLLDADGAYAEHITNPGASAAERTVCPQSGQPYTDPMEGEACETTDTADQGDVSPSTAAPGSAPRDDARPPSQPESSANQSEEMISKWAATARKIEDRKLPPSPESTTTPTSSPPPRSEPDQEPATKSAGTPVSVANEAPTAPPAADTSTGSQPSSPSSSGATPQPCHIATPHPPHRWMHRRKATQCPGKPAPTTAPTESAPVLNSAGDAAAASEAAPSGTKGNSGATATHSCGQTPHLKGCKTTYPAAPTSAPAAEPSTAATRPTPAGAPPSSDAVPPYIAALAGIFPAKPPPPGEPWYVPDAGGGSEPIDIRSLKVTGQNDDGSLNLVERNPAPPSLFAQPGSPFSQPGKVEPAPAAVPMTVKGEQIAAAMRQLFFDYDNRRSSDNRSAQTTLGPSEIGTPCDRRLAMSLLGIPPVNPGGDGWAAFVGTAVHASLAAMFEWASAGSGRYAVETPLTFPSEHVPRGTADLLDRTVCMVDDHKVQGKWSQNKLRTEGIPPGYRVQLHTYGLGQRIKGEQVDFVALISWPREASSLDDLYVVVEPYDPAIARDALARVDRIAAEIQPRHNAISLGHVRPLEVARQFPVADDCKFCPFFAPGDPGMTRGCNGRQ